MLDEPEPTPVAEPPAEPAEPPSQPAASPAAEPEAEVEGESGTAPSPSDAADLQKRIDQLTREKYDSRRQLDDLRSEITRWQQAQAQAQRPPGAPGAGDPVEEAKRQLRDEQVATAFNEACNNLYRRGQEEFGGDMDDAVRALQAVGWGAPNRAEALAILTQFPDAHRLYRELASDLDNAARVLNLPPVAMMREFARMERVRDAPAGGGAGSEPMVSRAPEPTRAVGGTSRAAERPLDHPQVTMAEFIRRRDREERRSRISR
jgi:hypothetical protein